MVVRDAKRAAILFLRAGGSDLSDMSDMSDRSDQAPSGYCGRDNKKREDFGIEIFSWWVKCGFRTHDLRNHNPTL